MSAVTSSYGTASETLQQPMPKATRAIIDRLAKEIDERGNGITEDDVWDVSHRLKGVPRDTIRMWLSTRVTTQPPPKQTNILGRSPKATDFRNHPPVWYQKLQSKKKAQEQGGRAAQSNPPSKPTNRLGKPQKTTGTEGLPIEVESSPVHSRSILRKTGTATHRQSKVNEISDSESSTFSAQSSSSSSTESSEGSGSYASSELGEDLETDTHLPKNRDHAALASISSDSETGSETGSPVREGITKGGLDEGKVSDNPRARFAHRPETPFDHSPMPDSDSKAGVEMPDSEAGTRIANSDHEAGAELALEADNGQQVQAAKKLAGFSKAILSDMIRILYKGIDKRFRPNPKETPAHQLAAWRDRKETNKLMARRRREKAGIGKARRGSLRLELRRLQSDLGSYWRHKYCQEKNRKGKMPGWKPLIR